MELERSLESKSAKSIFFEDVNDIDIFIEDTSYGYEKLFSLLFSRVFQNEYKVSKVFPLGGRDSVLSEYEKDSSNRPRVYIVDGDLYLVTGDTIENGDGLFKFPFYCVENVLCHPESMLEILDEEDPVKDREELNKCFNYAQWLSNNEAKLFKLFIEYGISMVLNPQQQTVAFKVSELVSCNKGEIDERKLVSRLKMLRDASVNCSSEQEYDEARKMILSNFESAGIDKLDIVSGKDYLFPLLKTRAKSVVKTKISDINFKLRLARKCDISALEHVKQCVVM